MNTLIRGLSLGAAAITAAVGLAVSPATAAELPVEPAASELDIMVASDVHVFAEELWRTADGSISPDFQQAIDGDRKMMPQSQEIFTAYIDKVIARQPDILMIPGDLTKDGEIASHEYVAAQIKRAQDAVPGLIVYVTNGNHDINTPNHSRNYSSQPATQAPFVTPDDYARIYAPVLEQPSITAHYPLPAGAQAGRFSYVAQPAPGYTFIVLDGGKYTADNTDSGKDVQETGGRFTPELLTWATEQIAAAEARGDVVVGMTHWGINEHFSYEPTILSQYLIDDYQNVGQTLMNAGLDYIFTGHMHANDIAVVTGEQGDAETTEISDKRLVDIETGSLVTYPSPSRELTLSRSVTTDAAGERTATATMDITTNYGDWITPLSFTDNLEEFGKEATGFDPGFLRNVIPGLINGYADKIIANGGIEAFLETNWTNGMNVSTLLAGMTGGAAPASFADFKAQVLVPKIAALIEQADGKLQSMGAGFPLPGGLGTLDSGAAPAVVDELFAAVDRMLTRDAQGKVPLATMVTEAAMKLAEVEVVPGHTLIDLATYGYQTHLRGDETPSERPQWVNDIYAKLADGSLIIELADAVIDDSWDTLVRPMLDYVNTVSVTNIAEILENGGSAAADTSMPPLATFGVFTGTIIQQFYFTDWQNGAATWKPEYETLGPVIDMAEAILQEMPILGAGVTVKGKVTDLLRGMLIGTEDAPGLLRGSETVARASALQAAGGIAANASAFLQAALDSLLTDENGTADGHATYVTAHALAPQAPASNAAGDASAPAATPSLTPVATTEQNEATGLAGTGAGPELVTLTILGCLALAAGLVLARRQLHAQNEPTD